MTASACLSKDTAAKLSAVSKRIPIEQIGELAPDDYVGLIDDQAVEHLKLRLAAEDQHMPIWVRQNGNAAKMPYSVICGRHRLRAAKALGWQEIAVEVRADMHSTRAQLKSMQLIENLDRRVLRPIERACFIMERWLKEAEKLQEAAPKSQQQQAIRKRWDVLAETANTSGVARGAADEATAKIVDESAKNVRVYRSLYEKLVVPFPHEFDRINSHPFGENLTILGRIAGIPYAPEKGDNRRASAIAALLDPANDWQSWDQFASQVLGQGSTGERSAEGFGTITKAWNGMPLRERRKFVVEGLPKLLTKDMAGKLVDTLVQEFDL